MALRVFLDHGYVYRGGSHTPDNLTPRLGVDTNPDGAPGLSTYTTLESALEHGTKPQKKAQKIALDRLRPPLRGSLDDFSDRHVLIIPVTDDGDLNRGLLEEWALSRGAGAIHRLTQIILDAIVDWDVRIPS